MDAIDNIAWMSWVTLYITVDRQRDKWCKVESEGWRKWGRQKDIFCEAKREGMRGMGEKRK